MTVAELIAELQKLPTELEVFLHGESPFVDRVKSVGISKDLKPAAVVIEAD